MNATEQKTHRSVTASLQQQIDDVIEVTVALDRRLMEVRDLVSIDHRDKNLLKETVERHRERLAVVAQEHKMLREAYIANEQACLTFWGRLCWLVTGR